MKSFVLVGLAWLVFSIGVSEGRSQEIVLKGVDGREFAAVVVKIFNSSVVVRRATDGKVFDLPFDQLSPESQQELLVLKTGQEKKEAVEVSGDWRKLRVILEHPLDELGVAGLGSLGQEQRGAREIELRLPVGCWVKVNIKSHQKSLEHLIQFDGISAKWEFGNEGPRVTLRKDDGRTEIVGITLEEGTGSEVWFQKGEIPFAKTISIELQELGQIERIKESPVPINAICATNYPLTDPEIHAIGKSAPTALAIDLDYALMPSLSHFEGSKLESCSLEFLNEPEVMEGSKLKDYPVALPTLPELNYFNNFFSVIPGDYVDTLAAKAPSLRALTLSASHQKATFAEFHGMERFPNLEALSLAWATKITVRELLKASKLKVFSCDNGGLPESGEGYSDFPLLTGLTELKNTIGAFPGNLMTEWADKGGMKTLLELETYRSVDFRKLRDLEVLKLLRNDKRNDEMDFTSLNGLNRLRALKINNATQEEIEAIGQLSNAGQIESLFLYGGEFSDLSPLRSLVNLRVLEVSRSTGELNRFDLAIFPKLEHFAAGSLPMLEEIANLDSHPSLQYISLSACPALRSIGTSYAGSGVLGFRLYNVDQITDLSVLNGSGIEQLYVAYCDGLVSPLQFDFESIEYSLIYQCKNLEDRLPGK